MVRKLFIVDPDNERLYRSLRTALANEPDVEIFYDRRKGARGPRGRERRALSDVQERIHTDGFAVVRPAPPAAKEGNTRWSA
jgi:hypothetical protein